MNADSDINYNQCVMSKGLNYRYSRLLNDKYVTKSIVHTLS